MREKGARALPGVFDDHAELHDACAEAALATKAMKARERRRVVLRRLFTGSVHWLADSKGLQIR